MTFLNSKNNHFTTSLPVSLFCPLWNFINIYWIFYVYPSYMVSLNIFLQSYFFSLLCFQGNFLSSMSLFTNSLFTCAYQEESSKFKLFIGVSFYNLFFISKSICVLSIVLFLSVFVIFHNMTSSFTYIYIIVSNYLIFLGF